MTAEDRWEDDYLHSSAAQYQEAHERAYRQARADGVPAPDGWRRPHEPTCRICSYVIVRGECLGCAERAARTSLSERGKGDEPLASPAAMRDRDGLRPRSESDEVAAA